MRSMLLALALVSTACMDHHYRHESKPAGTWILQRGLLPETIRPYVLLSFWNGGAYVESRAQLSCRRERVTRYSDIEVIDIRAGSARWVGAVALWTVALGLLFVGTPVGWIPAMGGITVATVPLAGERTKRRTVGEHWEKRALAPGVCRDQPLGEVRVTLRAGRVTHELTTNQRGLALVPEVDPRTIRIVYVDDRAVPFFFR